MAGVDIWVTKLFSCLAYIAGFAYQLREGGGFDRTRIVGAFVSGSWACVEHASCGAEMHHLHDKVAALEMELQGERRRHQEVVAKLEDMQEQIHRYTPT